MNRWVRRLLVRSAAATAMVLFALPVSASATPRAAGGVTIYDDPGCVGNGNAAKVTVPFSVLITGLTPFSQSSTLYVTDKDAKPEVTYGPFTIPNVDGQGVACLDVIVAPAGSWKVDVVEEGSGFTDSKVFTIEGPPAPPTVPPQTSPFTAPPPPTTGSPTTSGSVPSKSTTTLTPTTAPASSSTIAPATLPGIALPWSRVPWAVLPAAPPQATTTAPPSPTDPVPGLPPTGYSNRNWIVASGLLVGLGIIVLTVSRRRSDITDRDSPMQ